MDTHSLKHKGGMKLVPPWSPTPHHIIMNGTHPAGTWGVLFHPHHLVSSDIYSNSKCCKIHFLIISTSHLHTSL